MTNEERTQLFETIAEYQTERVSEREWRDFYYDDTVNYLSSLSDEQLLCEEANV